MNQSQSLAFPGNGLVAAVTVKTGMAVAWKDAGLFLKLGDTGPVRLDDSAESIGSTVLVEIDGGIAVAWSTWKEGWVTRLRRCQAGPLHCGPIFELRRPSMEIPSEWVPRMLSCNHGLWALFVDGPYLNFLGYDSWSSGPVVDFGDESITAAMDCVDGEVVSLWVERNGTVQWRSTSNPPPWTPPLPLNATNATNSPFSPTASLRSLASKGEAKETEHGKERVKPVESVLENLRFRSSKIQRLDFASFDQVWPSWAPSSPSLLDGPNGGLGPGGLSLLAANGYILVVSNNAPKLQVQLFNYLHPARYPVHDLAPAQNVEVIMDCPEGDCRGTVLCWSSGGVFGEDASFQCTYRGFEGLMNVDGLGTAGQMVLIVMFSLLFLLCLLKQCSGGGFRRRLFVQTEEPQRREARERVSELRSQLAQIPLVPVQGCEAPSTSACPICQNEVQIRVALQRCGHTACRDCTTRLVDMAQPCHICRAPIEGLQIVYI